MKGFSNAIIPSFIINPSIKHGENMVLIQPKRVKRLFAMLILMCGIFAASFAQTTLYQQGFNSTSTPAGWAIYNDGSTITFVSSGTYPTCSPEEGSDMVYFNSFYAAAGDYSQLYQTSGVSTVGYSNITVHFYWQQQTAYNVGDGVTVQWTTNNWGTTNNSTFYPSYTGGTGWELVSLVLPAGAAGASSLQISFDFLSEYGDNCFLDNFYLTGSPLCAGYYNGTNAYGDGWQWVTPSCTAQSLTGTNAPPSTSYCPWYATAGVTYTFTCSGSGWSGNDITIYYYNGSNWVPFYNSTTGTATFTVTSAAVAYTTEMLCSVYNGTGDCPAWITSSAVLGYVITAPTAPAIAQSPTSGSQVCIPGGVTYTASGITIGSFNGFYYGWNAVGNNALFSPNTTNPNTWTSCCNGNGPLYVYAQSNNGGCTTNSSTVTVTPDIASAAGTFVTSPIYSCGSGTLYNAAGTALAGEALNAGSYTGSITGWGWGTNTTTCSSNTGGFPYSAGSTNMNLTCCWPGVGSGSTDVISVEITNGVCAGVWSCIDVTENGMVAPTGASISPTGPVCAPTSGNITLTYTGGSGGNIAGGVVYWYTGSCGGTYIGSGQNLSVAAPSATTTYYCAWRSPCGDITACASATFTVVPSPTLSSTSYNICASGGTATLSSTDAGTWSSGTTSVATVSGSTVTGVSAGTSTLKLTTTASPGCVYTLGTAITVTALPTVSITGPTTFCTNATTTLSPTSGGTWVSNNTSVATVSGYTVTGATAGGSTNFTFTSSTSPDCANTTANVTVTALPTIYGVTGGGTYCLGSSDQVGLSNSQTGVTYTLYLNGVSTGSTLAGSTGSAINFTNITAVGTYTIVGVTNTNSCSQAMSGSVVVSELSPVVTNNPGATGIGTNGATLNGTD